MTSSILLQQFLTGLRTPVSKQVLLRGQPGNLEEAISEATRVEYALNFDAQTRPTSSSVNVVHKQEHCQAPKKKRDSPTVETIGWEEVRRMLETISSRIEA